MKDYYKILELPFGASSSAIKTAYRKLAFCFHPDRNLNNKKAEEKFKEIVEAYSVLSDENKRMIYHSDYNDFLNNKYISRIPKPQYQQPKYYHPTDIPKQPRGPATKYDDSLDSLRIAILALLILLLSYLLIISIKEIRERDKQQKKEISSTQKVNINQHQTRISEDDFYKILSQDFLLTGDSTLLKSNIDSLKHIFDSLKNVN